MEEKPAARRVEVRDERRGCAAWLRAAGSSRRRSASARARRAARTARGAASLSIAPRRSASFRSAQQAERRHDALAPGEARRPAEGLESGFEAGLGELGMDELGGAALGSGARSARADGDASSAVSLAAYPRPGSTSARRLATGARGRDRAHLCRGLVALCAQIACASRQLVEAAGARLWRAAAGEALVEEEQEHRADHRADEPAEVEGVLVADVEELREDQESRRTTPARPRTIVMRRPMLCLPGRSARAMKPARMPRTIAPSISEKSMRGTYPTARTGSRTAQPRTTKAAPEGGFQSKNRRRPTLPGPRGPSTIGAERLNCSVRNGKRCFPLAIATEFCETKAPRGDAQALEEA